MFNRRCLWAVKAAFLLWGAVGAESVFVTQRGVKGRASLPPPSTLEDQQPLLSNINYGLHPAIECCAPISDGLLAVRRTKDPTNEYIKRRLPKQKKPPPIHTNTTREKTVVIMYHKPPNVITSHSNADKVSSSSSDGNNGRITVYDDIYSMKGFVSADTPVDASVSFEQVTQITSKLHAIGRLDADTTGLLLLTNDGGLVHRITNPNAKNDGGKNKVLPVQKTYEAVIMGHHSLPTQQSTSDHDDDNTITSKDTTNNEYPLQTLMDEGVTLSAKHGGQTKPVDALSILSHPSRSTTCVSITISEGKNRQIRRMFHAVGSGVMKLHRVSIGRLTLRGLSQGKDEPGAEEDPDVIGALQQGQWRLLTEDEIQDGLGWKCRYLDDEYDTSATRSKVEGRPSSGRRHGQRNRRKVRRP